MIATSPFDGIWTLTENAALVFSALIPEGCRLLEIGSGAGTQWWCEQGYQVTAIEAEEEFVGMSDRAKYVHAPLVGEWYDPSLICPVMREPFDAWIIDGPKGCLGRLHLLENLNDAHLPRHLLIDDTNRTDGQQITWWFLPKGYEIVAVGANSPGKAVHEAHVLERRNGA